MVTRRRVLIGLGAGLATATRAWPAMSRVLTAADVHVAGYPTVEAVRWIGERLIDIVVPAGQAPHKQAGPEPTPFHHRVALCRLGVEGLGRTEVLELEGFKCYEGKNAKEGIDLAILPIGDNFTMGPEDALRAVKLIEPKRVVPIHYNTFDVIKQDPHAWAARVEKETAAKVAVMKPGDTIEV